MSEHQNLFRVRSISGYRLSPFTQALYVSRYRIQTKTIYKNKRFALMKKIYLYLPLFFSAFSVLPSNASSKGLLSPNLLVTEAQQTPKGTTYKGVVTEKETGEPVMGAYVKVVGTKIMAITDAEGAFQLEYSGAQNAQIQISYIGMKPVTLPLAQDMKVEMESDSYELGGVVVTGIFKKGKESYTGSVATIDKNQLSQYRGTNLMQTLKNVDAIINFSIDNLNGSNPNNLPNLNIRGNSSLPMSVEEFNQGSKNNPNLPLVIMDGFEISIQKLMDYNDEEIESINILKDAAATAIMVRRAPTGSL